MIPIAAIRAAHRRDTEARIAGFPSACRYTQTGSTVSYVLPVRTSEPSKTRTLRLGGFAVVIDLEAEIALPLTAARPEPEKERIQIEDLGGQWWTYVISGAKPLKGTNCYLLELRSERSR